jgi:hypothetical protein
MLTPTSEAYEIYEAARQRMFGYRRDDQGEIIDPLWDPGSREVKEVMEEARLQMFGYCRNLQGKIVGTIEEAILGTESPQPSQTPESRRQLQSILGDISGLQAQADRVQRLLGVLRERR